ncbi:MAG: Fe-S cluster assembly protein IscX [Anaerolineales bacterium]|nr:Fe-S cluster assembly protein IscX [Anaerolineales bacterium]
MTLTWEASYGIALELRRRHQEVNLDEVSLGQIYRWVLELPEFEDDPALANDDILKSIYLEWYEEHIHGT